MSATTTATAPGWLTLRQAAEYQPYGIATLRRAIKATDPAAFPPPLKAKQGSKGTYIIRAADLDAWLESLPDA